MSGQKDWNWEAGKKEVANLALLKDQFFAVHEFAVSPDGEKIAVPVQKAEETCNVWVNDKLWEEEMERAWNLRFTRDGRLIALVRVDDAWTVAIDGKRWENEYDFVWDLKLSLDEKVIAVLAKRGMEYIVLANDKAWENGFISMRDYVLSDDGRKIAATVQVEKLAEGDIFKFAEGTWSVAQDGIAWDQKFINVYSPRFTPDGSHLAAQVRTDICEYTVAQDGEPWKNKFGSTWEPLYRSNDKGPLVPVRIGGAWTLAENGSPIWAGRYVQLWHQKVSPDKQHIAAVVATGFGRWTIAVDDTPWAVTFEDLVLPPVFSPDGKRLATIGKNGEEWFVVVDGQQWSLPFDMAWNPVFSPDGKTVAAKVEREGCLAYALNGRLWSPKFEMLWDPIFSPDGKQLLIRGVENGKYYRQVVPLDKIKNG
ncbi:MAG: WD40 repeat domain-containing protein [Deltaproteobacteria bacterium]|nr:WD40 repeat domain-containing protein [Deltaproteobacteria bacterium]